MKIWTSLTRHKNRLPGSLEDLQRQKLWRPVGLLRARIDDVEPGDSLVLLVAPVLPGHLDQLAGRVSGEQTPPLVPLNQGVPGAGAQRVDVDAGAGAGRAHHEPPVTDDRHTNSDQVSTACFSLQFENFIRKVSSFNSLN